LSTAEALEVAAQLVTLGTREVTMIGGEAYLRPDLELLIAFLVDNGVRVTMQTGGRAVDLDMCKRLKDAGLSGIGVSIDGLKESHETLRGIKGGYDLCLRALDASRTAGLITTSNIQINRLNMGELAQLADVLQDHGVSVWQVQLTVPMGRAADHPDWIVQPWMMLEIVESLAEIQREAVRRVEGTNRRPFDIYAGNNIGYFGPHEVVLRSRPGKGAEHWNGCRAGQQVMGIEADGLIKACPSLPTAPYDGGNIRDTSLDEIWHHNDNMRFARDRDTSELWGFCKGCYYAETCRAGCSFTAHCTLGKRGNQPFCYYRASQLQRKGVRERLVHAVAPEGKPFDFGRFELVEEPWPAPE